jgi:hypothetical protein
MARFLPTCATDPMFDSKKKTMCLLTFDTLGAQEE